MVIWLAFIVSAVALAVSAASAAYTRRQAIAAEDAIWSTGTNNFDAYVENPNSGAAKLVISYRDGGLLDQVDVEIIDDENGPLVGFGVGTAEGADWRLGAARVGQTWTRPVIQRLRNSSGDGPPYRSGPVGLRLTCHSGRHRREILLDVDVRGQPWIY
ncbi:MAG: hypothetical protein R2761_28810 [Acidimicrobiales bacterium]